MIARLRGEIVGKDFTTVILDVAGVGYEIQLSRQAADAMSVGSKAVLYIAENIREDSYNLFGFIDIRQRGLYYQLNSVSGVGPKATMAILSGNAVEDIEAAIVAGNVVLFSSVSGIGRKTASRIVLELKGKLELAPQKAAADYPAYQALISLGYSAKQAASAVKDLPAEGSLDIKVKQALKELAK